MKLCNECNTENPDDAAFCSKCGQSINKKSYGWFIFFIALFAITTIIGFVMYLDADSDASNYRYKLSRMDEENTSLKSKLKQSDSALSTFVEKVGTNYPIVVNSATIENQDFNKSTWNSGTLFSASSTHYVRAKISYYGVKEGAITLKIKLYQPSEKLFKLKNSPSDCTREANIHITSGETSSYTSAGFGFDKSSGWSSGYWRYEIWYGSTILSSKSFYVFSL